MAEALDLDAIRERADAATPGPWRADLDRLAVRSDDDGWPIVLNVRLGDDDAPQACSDVEFIAAARSDVPALLDEVDRLHTWTGLMSLLDEHYPASVFPTEEDHDGRDPGPRVISLIRQLDEARNEIERLRAGTEAMRAAIESGCAISTSRSTQFSTGVPAWRVDAVNLAPPSTR